jgi:ABC-2 type transport system permease protein
MQTHTIDPGDLPVDARPRVLFNPELRTPNFMVPGLVAIIMQAITLMLTALSVVREKEAGTLEQLMVTPVSRLGLMLGKLLPYVVVACIETAIVVGLMVFLFQVPINGSVGLLALFSIPFLFTAIGMGLLTSTLTGNQMQALQVAMAFVLPAIVLSGFLFPRESMPLVINWLGYLFPATFFIEIIRGIVLRGAGFLDLWPEAAVLTLMGVAFLAVAASRFQKTLG